MKRTLWSEDTSAEVRRSQSEPANRRGPQGLQWCWRFGEAELRTPARRVHCGVCGGAIERGTQAIYVTHLETYAGAGWTPAQRYIHKAGCQ